MENEPIKLTKREKELTIYYDEAMNDKEYEKALSYINELIKLRKHNPVYHLWLGDCYRVSAQVDNALDSYRRALDLDGKYYAVGDDFREDVKRYINGLELIQKATQACQAKQYEEAIRWIDDFIKIDPNWGDMYALRGYCNDLLGNRVLAIKDYSLSLNRRLSEQARPGVEGNIKPTELRNLNLIMDKVEWDGGSGDAILIQEYIRLLKKIEECLPIHPEIADSPNFDRFCKDIDKLWKILVRNPGKTILIGLDEEGIFAVTQEELINKKRKHPERQYTFSSRVENNEQTESTTINAKWGSRLASKNRTLSESQKKRRERNRRYYSKTEVNLRLSGKQNDYDSKRRARIHFKNMFYRMLKNYGTGKTYMMKDLIEKSTKDSVYHQMRKDDFF